MTPTQTSRGQRRRGLTSRQASRRKKGLDENQVNGATNKNSGDRILTFGKASFVDQESNGISVHINNVDLGKISIEEINHAIEVARGPIAKFFRSGNKGSSPMYTRPAGHNMIHFGIWMNNVRHYSGGRVHLMLLAYNLAAIGHKVTIVTDNMPCFLDDLKFIEVEDRIEFVSNKKCLETNWLMKCDTNNIDVAIATPRIYEGFYYAKKWNLPCYAFILETPNYVSVFRGGPDSTEEYWSEYKRCIMEMADFVLSNPGPTFEAAKEWLKGFNGEFYECPPPINTDAADHVSSNEENEVAFIGRHLDFKCPDHVVFAVSKIPESERPAINFIGSHNDNVRKRILNKANPLGVECKFSAGVNDFEKFKILKRSKVLVIPTKFEGFGMPPAEAIYCNKPVVVYELPVTRHVYGEACIYVKKDDVKGLGKTIRELLRKPEKRAIQSDKAIRLMYSKDSNIPCLPMKIRSKLRDTFYGKHNNMGITAGIIVLNGADVIKLCLTSIHKCVDKIIIVEGAVEDYASQNIDQINENGRFHSTDGTMEKIYDFIESHIDCDGTDKIEIVGPPGRFWKNKNEMQNEIAKRVKTPLYLKVDADEIWKESDVEYCRRLYIKDKNLTTLYMRRWHFWKDLKTVAVGGQWDSAEARMWRWKEGFHHTMDDKKGFNYLVDKDGKRVNEDGGYKCARLLQRMHYHLGYCRKSEHIVGKIKYYANRGIEQNVKDNYSNWQKGQPTNSTHPDGTTAISFKGKLPFVLRSSYYKMVDANPVECTQNNLGMLNARSREG